MTMDERRKVMSKKLNTWCSFLFFLLSFVPGFIYVRLGEIGRRYPNNPPPSSEYYFLSDCMFYSSLLILCVGLFMFAKMSLRKDGSKAFYLLGLIIGGMFTPLLVVLFLIGPLLK